MTFRVPSKNAHSPAKFTITFNDSGNAAAGGKKDTEDNSGAGRAGRSHIAGGTNKDLRIYVSQEEKEPKEGRCDASYFSENVFFVHTQNKQAKMFETNNIYISFLSIKGCSINIKCKFTDPKGQRRQRTEKVYNDDPNQDDTPSTPLKKVKEMIKAEQLKMRTFKFKMQ